MSSTIILLQQSLSELPHLGFRRYAPHLQLHPWIQCYWTAQQYHLPEKGFTEILYPDGGSSLTFFFNSNQLTSTTFNASEVATKMHFQQSIDCIGIRFNPAGAFKLLGIDMSNINNNIQASDVLANNIEELQQQLTESTNVHLRLELIENWLLSQLLQFNPAQGLLEHFIPEFLNNTMDFDALIKQQAISRRQIERKFQQEIGLSPAQFKQLHRIKKSRQLISLDPHSPLIQIALDCGFYDQAHFIRQFQKVTGQTPGQYKIRKMSQKYNT